MNLKRSLAALSATTLVLTLGATAPADASAATKAPGRAGHWLEAQLTDGLVVGEYYDTWTDPSNPHWQEYNDYGLSADAALALRELGASPTTLGGIGDAVAQNLDHWITGVDYDTPDDTYAGSVAKAAVLARAVGADPTDFGGVDLIDRLDSLVATSAPIKGRIQDDSSYDYANVVGQAFAVRALGRSDSASYPKARNFFLEQQCKAGYFRLDFAVADAPDQSCHASSPPDTDVTALAVLSLEALPPAERRTEKVRTAVHDAVAWLKGQQKANGSFGGGTSTAGANTNSTGLAGWAFSEAGKCNVAVKAAAWVRKLQAIDEVPGERGGIAYDRAGFSAAAADGIAREARDQWRRATTQAAPVLLNRSLEACRAL